MVSAIVFDFDGLILDTETPIFASWSRVFDEHASTPLTMDEWSSEIGTVGGVDLVALFQSRAVTDIDVDELQARRRAHRDESLAESRATGRRTVDRGRAGSPASASRSPVRARGRVGRSPPTPPGIA
jgi:beta-phosphoglucomutase-like phosphatase (HAD superfamily)